MKIKQFLENLFSTVKRIWHRGKLVYGGEATEPSEPMGVPVMVVRGEQEISLQDESPEQILIRVLQAFDVKCLSLVITINCTDEIYDLLMNNEYFREEFGKRKIEITTQDIFDVNPRHRGHFIRFYFSKPTSN